MPNDMDAQALDLFTTSAARLVSIAAGLDPAQLDTPPAPGEWNIRQLIHHVTDDCDVWSMILKKALATPGAPVRFEGFPGNEAWAEGLDFANRDVRPALDAQNCPIQEFSVREIVQMLSEHMLEHVDTMETILAKANRNH